MITKSFESWTTEELEDAFGLKRNDKLPTLHIWLQETCEIPLAHRQQMAEMQAQLIPYMEMFNEADIKNYFIIRLIQLVSFWHETYRAFYEYSLSATKKDINGQDVLLKGRAEMLVAKGKQAAKTPFFFFHEYKAQIPKSKNDPRGQVLSSMLAAQVYNENDTPIYGCYVIGESWKFVVLEGNEFAVSETFNAMNEDIYRIYEIMFACKRYIHQKLNLPLP